MKQKTIIACSLVIGSAFALLSIAQPPPPRMHSIIERGELKPLPATSTPDAENEVKIEVVGDQRVITSNAIPNHKTGQFPNRGNPNRISPQLHKYRVPTKPEVADRATPIQHVFGLAVNGVPFEPGAGEFYAGEPGWQYEPLSAAIDLGIDVSHAHVQPTGKYHYHGLPTGLLEAVKIDPAKHSPLVGWAADGFPIYAVYGYSDPNDATSEVQPLTSSYQLKKGDRPGGDAPGGKYDGTFVADYEYVEGSGDLDECNGRQTVTPEFPDGTYAYYITEAWPVVPRMYRGTPSEDFRRGPRRGGPGQLVQGRGGPGRDGFGQGGPGRGGPGRGGPPRPGQVLPDFVQDSLQLTNEQKEQLADLQKTVDAKLAEILTDGQRKQLEEPSGFGRPGGQRGGARRGRSGQGRPERPGLGNRPRRPAS